MATVYEFNYTGSEQSVTLKPGKYKLECWGASGGAFGVDTRTECAKGGYAKGEITLKEKTDLLICVGQSGFEKVPRDSSFTRSGYNGGGKGNGIGNSAFKWSSFGGGATDIRLPHGSTPWNDSKGLLSRILVAGGGGATKADVSNASQRSYLGGNGGGIIGGRGFSNDGNFSSGGTQYEGGVCGALVHSGSFGKGGGDSDVGGGGGWYGGAGETRYGAGGGSGYALTKDNYKPPGYIPTSEYYLENVVMTTGGNTTKADGYAKITLLQALPFLTVSSYNSTTATFKADHTDPTLLTKIEYFIDDVLKETITTDLASEKTINYTLEDNALHTLKIVVTDSTNATAEKVVSISKNIMPLENDATLQDITNKIKEMKDGLKSGKRSIINVLELKDIDASLNNTFVELSEKVKDYFDSADSFFQETNKGKELIANAIGLPATKENTFSELATYINENKAKIVDTLVKKQQLVTIEDPWEIIANIIKELYSVTYSYSTNSIIKQESFTSQIANSTYPPGGGGSVSNYTYWLGYTFLNDANKIKVHIDCHKDNTSGSGYNEIRINFKHTSNGKVINSFTCDQSNSIDKEITDIKKGDYFYFEYYVGGVIGKTYSCGANAKIYGVINYIK
ncbi:MULTISPECIES: glycine rich domain-containing protein [unclassified Clostridioides]|uniref:glycine rich domain-containing protein n=1 Tax=unclassified Clostridioides TaxID=2635829 RepID=UPI001D11F3AE|nr:hypothetical protein [Clostridioides sp. ES-S-0049-03]MCC0678165.1 hypothetical protein [Clostridioides sp. ES-W-0018-02]MCC0712931.1 hypothetical protein [Clostridioides sp. ES-W-0017-02]